MKANELRIGNWIREKHRLFEYQMGANSFDFIEKHPDFCEGIPLTEEWLEKFGFEKDNRFDNQYRINGDRHHSLNILPLPHSYAPILRCENQKNVFELYGIKYVHQLQNFYFALTGEELQIKVPA